MHAPPPAREERGLSQAPQAPVGAAGAYKMMQEFWNLAAQVLGPKPASQNTTPKSSGWPEAGIHKGGYGLQAAWEMLPAPSGRHPPSWHEDPA